MEATIVRPRYWSGKNKSSSCCIAKLTTLHCTNMMSSITVVYSFAMEELAPQTIQHQLTLKTSYGTKDSFTATVDYAIWATSFVLTISSVCLASAMRGYTIESSFLRNTIMVWATKRTHSSAVLLTAFVSEKRGSRVIVDQSCAMISLDPSHAIIPAKWMQTDEWATSLRNMIRAAIPNEEQKSVHDHPTKRREVMLSEDPEEDWLLITARIWMWGTLLVAIKSYYNKARSQGRIRRSRSVTKWWGSLHLGIHFEGAETISSYWLYQYPQLSTR